MPLPLTTLLLAQRANRTTLADVPADLVPASREAAYQVQDETVRALGPVGAWKVAPMPADGVPFCSPILARDIYADKAALKLVDFLGLAIEVEVAVTIGRDLPAKAGGYTPDELRVALASIHVALEIVASRYTDRSKLPQLAGIADLQSGGAVVLGAAVSPINLPEFGEQVMSLRFDEETVQTTPGNATTDNVLVSLAWLADHAAARGMPLKQGDVVITGARLGPKPFASGTVTAEASGLGVVSVSFA